MLSYVKKWLAGFTINRRQMMESQRCAPRCGHISFCDGRNLYVWGGYHMNAGGTVTGMATDELWIYYVDFDVWVCQKCSGDLPALTTGACCCVVLPFAYIIGGHQSSFGHVSFIYRLHLGSLVWERVIISGENISPRDKFSAWAYGNKIYCFGGYGLDPVYGGLSENGDFAHDQTGTPGLGWNNQLLILDLSTHRWSNPQFQGQSSTPLPRAAHATVLLGDKVYLFGGRHQEHRMNDLHCLDLKTLSWSGQIMGFSRIPVGRSWHTLSALDDNRFFLYGGYTQMEDVLGDAWIFTVSAQYWMQVTAPISKPRLWHTAVITESKNILIFGGCTKNINREEGLDSTCYSDKVIIFQLQPSRLDLMCQQSVFRHFKQKDWKILPFTVQEWLNTKWRLREKWRALLPSDRRALGPHVVSGFHDSAGGGDPAS